eukprot:g968.t1
MRRFFARKKGGTKNESSWTSVEKKTESRKIDKLDPNYILAHTSEITGIPNGRQYMADIAELQTDAGTPPLRCVFSLDMANLKILNEEKLGGVGHDAADKVLEFFAHELEEAVNSAVSETAPVVLHNSYHMHGDEFCAVVASAMPDAAAFQAVMEKLAQQIAAIRFNSADPKCASYVLPGKSYPETYFRVGALCRSDADYDSADKLQEFVGVQMKADYPDRSKVVPLNGRTNYKFSTSGLSEAEKASLEAVANSEAGADDVLQEKALAEEILAFLDKAQSEKLDEGRKYIKTDNLEEAQAHFEGMLQRPKILSPEELKTAKQLLAFTLEKKGLNRLRGKEFDEAASAFEKVIADGHDIVSHKRLRKIRLFHACALYEAGKKHREDGDWGEAKKHFEGAKKTKALPSKLQEKTSGYLKECKKMSRRVEDGPSDEDSSSSNDAGDSETEAFSPEETEAFKVYKVAKRSMACGMANTACKQFEMAKKIGLPKQFKKRAKKLLRWLEDLLEEQEGQEATQSVFSDNFTHVLASSTATMGLSTSKLGISTATIGLSTQTVSASPDNPNRELVMVLDDEFPKNSKERASLMLKLKTDVRKAMALISEKTDIDIVDLAQGSIIVHFCFANDGSNTIELEEEYLRQIDDKESPIYKGEVTRNIDQERTNKMTTQLIANRGALMPCPHEVGDTITLAQIQDEKIECKVDSKLGEGATATVFKVSTSGKARALKVFKAQNSLNDLCEEASLMLTANFPHSHPNVMRADFVWYEQRTNEMFFLLELVDGDDLQAWIDDERLYAGTGAEQEERLILIVHQLACGLQHLHLRGILHEDFKPDNVFMTRGGVPVIGDLGVGDEGTVDDEGMVEAMLRGGTPVYASPNVRQLFFQAKALPLTERKGFLQAHPITHRDDFFALGATVLEMFAECGWRLGRSVAEVFASNDLTQLLDDKNLFRVAVPTGVVEVLQACFSADKSLTVDSIVELTTKLCDQLTLSTSEGMAARRCANIRNNLGVALFDSGMLKREEDKEDESMRFFEAAQSQLEHGITSHSDDARTLNNLGVVKLTQGMADEAKECFDNALAADPNHAAATFNKSQGDRVGASLLLDRTGAAGAVEDSRGKVELTSALSFAPGQQLEVYQRGRWETVDASEVEKATGKPLLLLNYRPAKNERVGTRPAYYATEQQLLVYHEKSWFVGKVKKHFKNEFEQEAKQVEGARKKEEAAEEKARAQAEQARKNTEQAAKASAKGKTSEKGKASEKKEKKAEAQRRRKEEEKYKAIAAKHRQEEHLHRQTAQQLENKHIIVLAGHGEMTMKSVPTNHAPAFFTDLATIGRAQQAYTIELKDKHAFILDLFSGQKLNTRTQTASLRYREKGRAEQTMFNDQDVDSEEYLKERKASAMQSSTHSVKATTILREMLGGDDRADARLRRYLLLILGPAAAGKTTLLKTFMMEMAHRYPDFVPILIPVIDVTSVLKTCKRDEGESVVAAFIQRKYPQHAHLLLQMMLMRRAVFLIDGIDESGTYRAAVEAFVTIELLEAGHKTIITSRHSGFSSEAFKQCRLVELLPLSMEQQSAMVHTRVPDEKKAERLVGELQSKAFEEIASNPLMLSMMISIYTSNGYKLISNRSELYEKALETLMGRSDKGRAGLDQASQQNLFEHLQKLASGSHQRLGERRIFTAAQASEWASPEGWSAIEGAMHAGRMPIISSLGPNEKDEEEYR